MAAGARFSAAARRIVELCDGIGAGDRELRRALLEAIRSVVPFDAFAWLLTDPETCVGSSPLAEVPFLPELPRAIRLKYLTAVNRWTGLDKPVAVLSATTGGDLAQSLMWREVLHRHEIVDAASAVFRDRRGCWGFLELWRRGEPGPFTATEAEFLAGVADPITRALRRCQAQTFCSASPALPRPGPVVLLLSPDLVVRAQTAEVESYLRTLVPPDPGAAPVPSGAYNVAAQLLAVEAGIDDHPALARGHLGNGVWLTMKAARIEDGTGDEADIAVSIELASTRERASVFARAFALTERETELVNVLTSGTDTRGVAQAMHLSEHTVQDHLKSIFAKTGLRSRSALLSAITGH